MLLLVVTLVSVAALSVGCGQGDGGPAYGAGGGQSLREGSTSAYHSDIAQDETYQKILGMNIILYPAPVDDPTFEPYGTPHWELDPSGFVEVMLDTFSGEMGDELVYEPVVQELQEEPLVQDIRDLVYDGEPVQVGLAYGNNDSMNFLQHIGAPVTLVTAHNVVLFAGHKDDLDSETWTYDAGDAEAFYIPENAVIELYADTLHSMPVRAERATGQLTAIITPEGVGLEGVAPGEGIDQALVANDRWVFALPGVDDYYEGLTGSNVSIEPAD